MENIEKEGGEIPERKLVTYEESRKLAEELLARFKNEILGNMQKDVDGWGPVYADFQNSIKHFLKEVPEDILKHYGAHGITKGSEVDRLAGALNILANRSMKGWYGPLGGEAGGYNAYRNGDFLVVSKFDKSLAIKEEKGGEEKPVFDAMGWKADIGAFVVDVRFYPLIEEFKKMFPDVNIIRANEIPGYFETDNGRAEE